MFRYRLLLCAATLSLFAVHPMLFANVQVGTCKANLQSFPTISAAISSVRPGSTILVCPGTYPEQVTITQPLTLQGVSSGTANQVLITVPSGGLLPNAISLFGESVAAQVLVQGAGPVNISNISVDGTGGDMACVSNIWIAGIFFGSSSSGSVNRVRTSGQIDGTCGVGIWAENGDSSSESITIQQSTVYNVDGGGIFAGSGATPTLSVNAHDNVVTSSTALAGILLNGVNGVVRANDISNVLVGVFDVAPAVQVAANTILATGYGMLLLGGGTVINNDISGTNVGIVLGGPGATIQGNHILSSSTIGVELSCLAASVTNNLINDAAVGIDQAPVGVGGSNTFANTVTTIANSCGFAPASSAAMRARSLAQWHTPATPFGTRRK